jgi:hypothetical protein
VKLTHPKCGKAYTHSERVGHCAACCETFKGIIAFDLHRVGEHGAGRRCLTVLELQEVELWDTDNKGYWRYAYVPYAGSRA